VAFWGTTPAILSDDMLIGSVKTTGALAFIIRSTLFSRAHPFSKPPRLTRNRFLTYSPPPLLLLLLSAKLNSLWQFSFDMFSLKVPTPKVFTMRTCPFLQQIPPTFRHLTRSPHCVPPTHDDLVISPPQFFPLLVIVLDNPGTVVEFLVTL